MIRINTKVIFENIFTGLLFISTLAVGVFLISIVGFLLIEGAKVISIDFLLSPPKRGMTEGGIFPCIVGTTLLSLGSLMISFPVGVVTAVYINEYARPGRLINLLMFGINTLASIPSVVFGLFGLALFVITLKMGISLVSGCLTLAALILPIIIASTQEALKAVPDTYREASYGLGATRLQTVFRVVLPAAMPGILTGSILSLARAAGETAPIMFTGAVFFKADIPHSLFDSVMALPYHIYVLATSGIDVDKTRPIQFGTALVLIFLVLGLNLIAIIIRGKIQKRR